MPLNFDISRPPALPHELVALVRAVETAGPGDETTWLEWKSGLDLGSPDGRIAVVKPIIGLANRLPAAAAQYCAGRGYIIIGAEPANIDGVRPADPADLTGWWLPYLGADGPQWHPHWVSIDGKDVLIVEVAAPKPGDPVYAVRKELTGTGRNAIRDGDVFVRHPGQTIRASSTELAALVARAASPPRLTGIAVTLDQPPSITVVDFSGEAVSEWTGNVRQLLMSSLEKHRNREQETRHLGDFTPVAADDDVQEDLNLSFAELEDLERRQADGEELSPEELDQLSRAKRRISGIVAPLLKSLSGFAATRPDERSPDEYEKEVEEYLKEVQSVLPSMLPAMATRVIPHCRFALHNQTDSNIVGVEVIIRIPGIISALDPIEVEKPELPSPPRSYGARRVSGLGLGGFALPRPHRISPRTFIKSSVHIDNDQPSNLRFDPVSLRPRKTVLLPAVVLIAQSGVSNPITATWQATSSGLDGVATGETTINVSEAVLTVADAVRGPKDGQPDDR